MKPLDRESIAARVACDIEDGWHVNLGIGMPEAIAAHLGDREVVLHSENGVLGMGPPPAPGAEDPNLINAGKHPITVLPGASYFDHATSFAIVRGGHLDLCVMGAFQVARTGDLANWSRDHDDPLPAIGGAMDLAVGAQRIFVMINHVDRNGRPSILESCTYPLTASGVVRRIYTDLAVIAVTPDGLVVEEMLEGLSDTDLQARTGAPLEFASTCGTLSGLEAA